MKDLFQFLIYLFEGFGLYLILKWFAYIFKLNKFPFFEDRLKNSVINIIKWSGILWLIVLSISFLISQLNADQDHIIQRATGPYAWAYWMMAIHYPIISQLLWIRKTTADNCFLLLFGGLFFLNGPSFEKYVITVTSLHRDYAPSNWKSSLFFGLSNLSEYFIKAFLGFAFLLFLAFVISRLKKEMISLNNKKD